MKKITDAHKIIKNIIKNNNNKSLGHYNLVKDLIG